MALRMSLAPGETIVVAGGARVTFNNRAEFAVSDGEFRFIREKHYIHPDNVNGDLKGALCYALQEHYLNDQPVKNIKEAADNLTAVIKDVKPIVDQVMRHVRNKEIYTAIVYAAKTLG